MSVIASRRKTTGDSPAAGGIAPRGGGRQRLVVTAVARQRRPVAQTRVVAEEPLDGGGRFLAVGRGRRGGSRILGRERRERESRHNRACHLQYLRTSATSNL